MAAAPERGAANEAVLELVAAALGVDRSRVALVAGSSARDKVVEVEGLGAAEAERLLEAAARPAMQPRES